MKKTRSNTYKQKEGVLIVFGVVFMCFFCVFFVWGGCCVGFLFFVVCGGVFVLLCIYIVVVVYIYISCIIVFILVTYGYFIFE